MKTAFIVLVALVLGCQGAQITSFDQPGGADPDQQDTEESGVPWADGDGGRADGDHQGGEWEFPGDTDEIPIPPDTDPDVDIDDETAQEDSEQPEQADSTEEEVPPGDPDQETEQELVEADGDPDPDPDIDIAEVEYPAEIDPEPEVADYEHTPLGEECTSHEECLDGSWCNGDEFCWANGGFVDVGVCVSGRAVNCITDIMEPGQPYGRYACIYNPKCIEGAAPNTGYCELSILRGYCFVDNLCYSDGEASPNNYCQYCNASFSRRWTSYPTGWPCGWQEGYTCQGADYCCAVGQGCITPDGN